MGNESGFEGLPHLKMIGDGHVVLIADEEKVWVKLLAGITFNGKISHGDNSTPVSYTLRYSESTALLFFSDPLAVDENNIIFDNEKPRHNLIIEGVSNDGICFRSNHNLNESSIKCVPGIPKQITLEIKPLSVEIDFIDESLSGSLSYSNIPGICSQFASIKCPDGQAVELYTPENSMAEDNSTNAFLLLGFNAKTNYIGTYYREQFVFNYARILTFFMEGVCWPRWMLHKTNYGARFLASASPHPHGRRISYDTNNMGPIEPLLAKIYEFITNSFTKSTKVSTVIPWANTFGEHFEQHFMNMMICLEGLCHSYMGKDRRFIIPNDIWSKHSDTIKETLKIAVVETGFVGKQKRDLTKRITGRVVQLNRATLEDSVMSLLIELGIPPIKFMANIDTIIEARNHIAHTGTTPDFPNDNKTGLIQEHHDLRTILYAIVSAIIGLELSFTS